MYRVLLPWRRSRYENEYFRAYAATVQAKHVYAAVLTPHWAEIDDGGGFDLHIVRPKGMSHEEFKYEVDRQLLERGFYLL